MINIAGENPLDSHNKLIKKEKKKDKYSTAVGKNVEEGCRVKPPLMWRVQIPAITLLADECRATSRDPSAR
jgi:hypothetical protein